MIKVSASLVDGSLLEFNLPDNIVQRMRILRSDGYEGKSLIHELITDDWGPPPNYVDIKGVTEDGEKIDERIPYY